VATDLVPQQHLDVADGIRGVSCVAQARLVAKVEVAAQMMEPADHVRIRRGGALDPERRKITLDTNRILRKIDSVVDDFTSA